MRFAGCAPLLGLLAAAAFGQTAPDRQDINRKMVESAMPRLAPGLSQLQELQPPPVPALRTSFVESGAVPKTGANRNVIARAVRSLAARIFPSRGPEPAEGHGFTLIDRSLAGADFHL